MTVLFLDLRNAWSGLIYLLQYYIFENMNWVIFWLKPHPIHFFHEAKFLASNESNMKNSNGQTCFEMKNYIIYVYEISSEVQFEILELYDAQSWLQLRYSKQMPRHKVGLK